MDLDIDKFHVALESLKTILNKDAHATSNKALDLIDDSICGTSSLRAFDEKTFRSVSSKKFGHKTEQMAKANPLRERMRTNLDLIEADMSVGQSILLSRYATQLGFRKKSAQNESQLYKNQLSDQLNLTYPRQKSTVNAKSVPPSRHPTMLNFNRTRISKLDSEFLNQTVPTSVHFSKMHSAPAGILRKRTNLSNVDLNVTDRVKTLKKSDSKDGDFTTVINPIFDKRVELVHSAKTAAFNTNQSENLPFLPSEDSDLQSSSGASYSNNNTISKAEKPSISNTLPLINEANTANLTIGRRRITLKRHPNSVAAKRFRHAITITKLLLKAVSSIKQGETQRNEEKYERVNMHGLIFDVNSYKKPKEIGLTDEAKRILKLPVESRTDEQIKIAVSSLIEAVPEYQDFPINMQRSIAKVCMLQEFETGRVIIRQDHKADNFYFIVSGITAISVSKVSSVTGEPINEVVAYLSKGRSFGELAIIHAAKRNATVSCYNDVSVLSIGREDFIDIFMHYEKGQEPEHITFLRTIDVLEGWPIDKLPYNDPRVCCITYFRKGSLICKDSNKSDWIFFIKQGKCRVVKDIPLTKKSIMSISKSIDATNKSLELKFQNLQAMAPKIADDDPKLLTEDFKKNRRTVYELLQKKSVYTEVTHLFAKDTFGLVEVLFGNIEGATSVSLISDGAECILIHKNFFTKHLSDKLRKHLRETVAPFPPDQELEKKFQVNIHWQTFKKSTLNQIYEKNYA